MSGPRKLDAGKAQLLVVDLQVKLLPLIRGHEQVMSTCARIIRTADLFGLPITVTEQYPQGIGTTHPGILDTLASVEHSKFEKMSCSCCGDKSIADRLTSVGRRQVLVTGIEAHVCVQQTVLDLLSLQWEPFVLADAISSRVELDYDVSLLRMQQAGAVITTCESIMFELAAVSGTEPFKRVVEMVKETL